MSLVPASVSQHFAFAFGRTAVLQQVLLRQADVDRLLGAHDRRDAEKMITELNFTDRIDQGLQKGEAMLAAVARWIRNEVESMSPPTLRPVFSILWIDNDGALLSYLLKQHHGLTSAIGQEPESEVTAYEPDAVRRLVSEGTSDELPESLIEFVQEMRALENPAPQAIDARVARFIAEKKTQLARLSGSPLIKKFVAHSIDILNLQISLRAYGEELKTEAFLPGGTLDTATLAGQNKQVMASLGRSSLYLFAERIEAAGEDPVAREHAAADVLAEDISEMWNIPMSIEPLFAFAAIGLSHARLIRAVLIGKGNGLRPQELKQILPPFIRVTHYVS